MRCWLFPILSGTTGSKRELRSRCKEIVYQKTDNCSYNDDIATTKKFLSNALANLYPEIPSPPIAHSLPLEAYSGYYHHEAYPSFTIDRHNHGLEIIVKSDLMAAKLIWSLYQGNIGL